MSREISRKGRPIHDENSKKCRGHPRPGRDRTGLRPGGEHAGSRSGGARADGGEGAARETLESIHAEFRRGVADLERARLERLARLAAGQAGDEARKTYEEYFRLVIANGLYREAEPTAERAMKSGGISKEVGALAVLVNIIAEADRGAYQDSIASIASAIEAGGDGGAIKPAASLPLETRLALINAYYRRLLQSGQFEIARKALRLIGDNSRDPVIKDLAAGRLKQLDMLGKPAPPIAGTDVDGRPFRLEDWKGDVVLVEFWASWSLPSPGDRPAQGTRRVLSDAGIPGPGDRPRHGAGRRPGARGGDAEHPAIPARPQRPLAEPDQRAGRARLRRRLRRDRDPRKRPDRPRRQGHPPRPDPLEPRGGRGQGRRPMSPRALTLERTTLRGPPQRAPTAQGGSACGASSSSPARANRRARA